MTENLVYIRNLISEKVRLYVKDNFENIIRKVTLNKLKSMYLSTLFIFLLSLIMVLKLSILHYLSGKCRSPFYRNNLLHVY